MRNLLSWLLNKSKPPTSRELLGQWGEKQAEKFLRKKGFKILTRNFNCKTGEIDLIMADGDGTIVFVEVKTRADEVFADAESAITEVKKNRMTKAARYFLSINKIEYRPSRFDVVVVLPGEKQPHIRHYKNAFVP